MKRASTNVLISLLLGFLSLGNSIQSIQELTKTFANEADKSAFIDNWLALIVIVFFMAGWFASHWTESLLRKNQTRYVKLLFIAFFLIGYIATPIYLRFFIHNEILNYFGFTSFYLIASGFLLRYSAFDHELFLLSEKMFSLRKK
jgi:hypothetical protein